MEIVKKVLDLLKEKKLTISFAESITGGALAAELVKYTGASDVLSDSYVVYSDAVKNSLLGVDFKTLLKHSAVSYEVSKEMVKGLFYKTNAKISVSITGYAEHENKKLNGLVFYSISYGDRVLTYKIKADVFNDYEKVSAKLDKEYKRKKIIENVIINVYENIFTLLNNPKNSNHMYNEDMGLRYSDKSIKNDDLMVMRFDNKYNVLYHPLRVNEHHLLKDVFCYSLDDENIIRKNCWANHIGSIISKVELPLNENGEYKPEETGRKGIIEDYLTFEEYMKVG